MRCIILVPCIVFALGACEPAGPAGDDERGRAQGSASVSRSGTERLRPASADSLPLSLYTPLDSISMDMNADGAPERITVLATIETRQGEPLVEDGHHWLVLLQRDTTHVRLFERFVPWGDVRIWAVREREGDEPVIALLVQAVSAHGEQVGSELQKFVFDPRTGGFSRTDSVGAYGVGVHRAPLAGQTTNPDTAGGI